MIPIHGRLYDPPGALKMRDFGANVKKGTARRGV